MHKTRTKIAIFASLLLLALVSLPQDSSAQTDPNFGIAEKIRASFSDMPDMITIAQCESGSRQFRPDGSVLRGGSGGHYIGIFQIDENIHTARALSMAYDIQTVDGNIAYARYMYFASGSNPWRSCLGGSTPTPSPAPSPTPIPVTPAVAPVTATVPSTSGSTSQIISNLNIGMTHPEVLILQQILNRSGFAVASSGPGSPGNETSTFGSLTREAVRRFQCAKMNICSGTESSTGYGRVGPMTRAALAGL